jgi:CheY-like chemotaxis protein
VAENEPVAVLIAEDSTKMREQLIADVTSFGVTAIGAKTGLEALKLVSEHRPPVILLDGLLPEMHGFEVARAIRNIDPNYRPQIAIITGVYKSTQYQNDARLRYGINDYLIKPVKKSTLREVLARSLSFSFPEK